MATNIYDVLAGQSAIDVFNKDVYPTGDPETRGGMYSRAKGYGGLAQLANLYLEMAGLPPTQENYDMAFRALGAGAPVPVVEELPEGKSAMVAYFDRLLGRTPEEEEKKETIKEIMVEDESSEPQFNTGFTPDPTSWVDTTIDYHDLYPSYNFMDLVGRVSGLPSAVAGKLSGSAEENKAKTAKVQEILEQIYTPEVIEALDKEKKDEGFKFSLDKAVQSIFGITDPAAKLRDEDYLGRAEDLFNVGNIDKGGIVEGLFGPEYTQEGDSSKKGFEAFTREDFAREGETFLDIGPEEAQLNKENAAARAGVPVDVYDQLMSQRQFDSVGSAADLDRDMEYESFGDWMQALANSALTGQWGGSRKDVAKAALDAAKMRESGEGLTDEEKASKERADRAKTDPSGLGARDADDSDVGPGPDPNTVDTTPGPAPVHSDDEPPSDPSNPTGLSEEEKDDLDTMF